MTSTIILEYKLHFGGLKYKVMIKEYKYVVVDNF